jgi:hypothetical protein
MQLMVRQNKSHLVVQMFVRVARAQERRRVRHHRLAGVVEDKAIKQLDKGLSWFSKCVVIVTESGK